jgi:hypothetical protein
MSAETAQVILYAITALAVVVWAAGLRFLVRSVRKPKLADEALLHEFDPAGPPPEGLIVGHAEVQGRPPELAAKAASVLAREGVGPFAQLKILDRTENRVIFEGAGPGPRGQSPGQPVRRGELRFTAIGNDRTAIDYAIAIAEGRVLLALGAVFQILGLIAIVAGFWLVHTFVVPNPNPAVRGQTLQMLQVSHFLWPSFLFGSLYRMRRRGVQTRFDVLTHNLPYYED